MERTDGPFKLFSITSVIIVISIYTQFHRIQCSGVLVFIQLIQTKSLHCFSLSGYLAGGGGQ